MNFADHRGARWEGIWGKSAGRFVLFLVVLIAGSPSPGLTIATYNVENYLVTNRMVDGVYREAYPKPEQEKAGLRQVIAGIAPDILAIEEMGPQPFLDELQRELKQGGQDFPFAVLLEAADPDRHVAVLSKLPFKRILRHAAVPINYLGHKDVVKRGVLEVILATDAGEFSLFVVHLKSRLTEQKDDPESALRRHEEARAVRDVVLSRYPDPARGRFILCGDWNDTLGSKSVRMLTRRGELEVGEILPAADSHGETWTHFYRREDTYSRIDYLLVSPALKPLVAGGRAKIWDGAGASDGSDHRAVYVRIESEPVN